MDTRMRYLIGATYLVVSSSLLSLLVEPGGGLALLLRAAVWLAGTAGPLFCAVESAGDALHARLDGRG